MDTFPESGKTQLMHDRDDQDDRHIFYLACPGLNALLRLEVMNRKGDSMQCQTTLTVHREDKIAHRC